jgi:7,8-dihydroneopterin 2',3'-cyclic phosphate phosphodiesterase
MKDLLAFAGRIVDPGLRKSVISMLVSPGPTTGHPRLRPAAFDKAPASTDWHHTKTGGLLAHTYAVTANCMSIAENMRKAYGTEVDMDTLIAGALLHDIGKVWTYRKGKSGWESADLSLDHTMLGTAELYSRGFPEHVVHMVASHFGDNGPTPPMSVEARILHAADDLDARLNEDGKDNIVQLVLG